MDRPVARVLQREVRRRVSLQRVIEPVLGADLSRGDSLRDL